MLSENLQITLSSALIIFLCMLASFFLGNLIIRTANAAQTKQATNSLDAYAPFEEILQITASDSTTYSPPLRGCIVETDGALALKAKKSAGNVTITVKAGQLVPVTIEKVLATGTTSEIVCGR